MQTDTHYFLTVNESEILFLVVVTVESIYCCYWCSGGQKKDKEVKYMEWFVLGGITGAMICARWWFR